jgi:hypothetical protein
MVPAMQRLLVITILLGLTAPARAEMWPTLEKYVQDCVLIVKAKAVKDGKQWTFRVDESWRGTYDPKLFAHTKDGRFFADQGEHGVQVVDGQEIIFFFTRHNQGHPTKLTRHSTAFPITKNKVVYASTGQPQHFTVADFKLAIQRVK